MTLTNEQIDSLVMFALEVLEDWPDGTSLDIGDLQDICERHKLLEPQIVHAPCCDDGCVCAEMCSDEDFARGVTCYHIADWLTRAAEQRDEAVGQGADESPKTLRTEDSDVPAGGICPLCDGRGVQHSKYNYSATCTRCKGTGHI